MIIENAIENQNYCKDSSIAKWFINSDTIIFTSEQLINGTSYNIQELPNYTIYWDDNSFTVYYPDTINYSVDINQITGKKITWDLGEHILNNPNNYSYRIDYTFSSCAYYYVRLDITFRENDRYNICRAILSQRNAVFRSFFNVGIQNPTDLKIELTDNSYMCGSSIRKQTQLRISGKWGCSGQNSGFIPMNDNLSLSKLYSFSINKLWIVPVSVNTIVSKRLIITDGGIEYSYSINNEGSVATIDFLIESKIIIINGNEFELIDENSINIIQFNNYKYTFNADNQSVEIITNQETNISLVCGVDCPPNTCVKCRDGDNICCYGDNGQVIETIYDPDNLVGGCC